MSQQLRGLVLPKDPATTWLLTTACHSSSRGIPCSHLPSAGTRKHMTFIHRHTQTYTSEKVKKDNLPALWVFENWQWAETESLLLLLGITLHIANSGNLSTETWAQDIRNCFRRQLLCLLNTCSNYQGSCRNRFDIIVLEGDCHDFFKETPQCFLPQKCGLCLIS